MLAEHYAGNDANVGTLLTGVLAAFEGISVEDFEAKSDAFLRAAQHPTLGRGYLECAYAPMVELLGYLAANGFTNYIASGGGRDFMRPISQEVYGIPRDRVIGSSNSPSIKTSFRSAYSSATTTASASSTTLAGPSRRWSGPPRTGGRSSA